MGRDLKQHYGNNSTNDNIMKEGEMNNSYRWSIEDVMEYFGEFVSREEGELFMKMVERRMPVKSTYNDKMRAMRILLKDEYGVKGIPFGSGYRRVKV